MKCYVCDTEATETSNGITVHTKCARPEPTGETFTTEGIVAIASFSDTNTGASVSLAHSSLQDLLKKHYSAPVFQEPLHWRDSPSVKRAAEEAKKQAELFRAAELERLRRELNGGKDEQRPHLGDWIRSEGRAIGEVSAVDFTENRATIDLFDTTKWDRIVVPFNQFKKDDDGFWSISLDAERSTTEAT